MAHLPELATTTSAPLDLEVDALVVPVFRGAIEGPGAEVALRALGLDEVPRDGDFRGRVGELCHLAAPGLACGRLTLVGLGRLDELKGLYLNAFDLYRQAAVFAETAQERNALYGALLRTRSHLRAEKINGSNQYIIRIEGNGSPLELHYDLEEESRREELYRNISAVIKRPAGRVLEFECAAGTVSRGLAAEGFTVEAASTSMTDLMLALGIDTYRSLQTIMLGSSPGKLTRAVDDLKSGGRTDFFKLDLNRHAARTVEKSDVIMLLPAEAQWYLSRGPMEVATLMQLLAARAHQQLIFYLPPGYSQAYRELCSCLLSTLDREQRLLKAGRPFSPLLGMEDSEGGRLYLTALS